MAALRIYTDESVHVAIAAELKRRKLDAWSARDVGNLGLSDEEQLEYASQEHAIIFTHDSDFLALAQEWLELGKEHWGIIHVQSFATVASLYPNIARFVESWGYVTF